MMDLPTTSIYGLNLEMGDAGTMATLWKTSERRPTQRHEMAWEASARKIGAKQRIMKAEIY